MSNGLDPDQGRHFVGPDLGPNCMLRLLGDDKVAASMLRVKIVNFKNRLFHCKIWTNPSFMISNSAKDRANR